MALTECRFDFLGEGSRHCKVAVGKRETGKKAARR